MIELFEKLKFNFQLTDQHFLALRGKLTVLSSERKDSAKTLTSATITSVGLV